MRARRVPADAPTDAAKDFEPVGDYRGLKEDVLNSWGFLSDQDFALRALAVIGAGFLPGVLFAAAVFPLRNAETGDLLVRNVAAAGFLGTFIGLCLLLAVIFRLAQVWDSVNKSLQRKTFFVEYDPTEKNFASGAGGAYNYKQAKSEKEIERDRLIAEYETEPAVGRLRVYLVGTLAATVTSLAGSLSVGGEVGLAKEDEEEEEEEEDPDSPRFYKAKKKACKEGCIPGLAD